MHKIQLFIKADCPHCHDALRIAGSLLEAHPEYADIIVEVIDEDNQPTLAAEYDYWYVPTYYVDGKKLHEGVPTPAAIAHVYASAFTG